MCIVILIINKHLLFYQMTTRGKCWLPFNSLDTFGKNIYIYIFMGCRKFCPQPCFPGCNALLHDVSLTCFSLYMYTITEVKQLKVRRILAELKRDCCLGGNTQDKILLQVHRPHAVSCVLSNVLLCVRGWCAEVGRNVCIVNTSCSVFVIEMWRLCLCAKDTVRSAWCFVMKD